MVDAGMDIEIVKHIQGVDVVQPIKEISADCSEDIRIKGEGEILSAITTCFKAWLSPFWMPSARLSIFIDLDAMTRSCWPICFWSVVFP